MELHDSVRDPVLENRGGISGLAMLFALSGISSSLTPAKRLRSGRAVGVWRRTESSRGAPVAALRLCQAGGRNLGVGSIGFRCRVAREPALERRGLPLGSRNFGSMHSI
jgi:hypothetical protein